MSRRHLISLAVLLAVGGAARASDPVGIYAVIERVVLEPSADPIKPSTGDTLTVSPSFDPSAKQGSQCC